MTRRLTPFLLLCLLACVAGLSACGNDDEDVGALLSQTFGGEGQEVESGRLDLNVRFNGEGLTNLQGPVGLRLNGPFASTKPGELPRFDFNAAVEIAGQNIEAGAVSTGEKGFLRFQGEDYAVSDELYGQFRKGYAEQAKCNEREGDKRGGVSFRSLGIDPRRWLRGARKEGEQEVGGADTIHISSDIDVPKFLEDVNRILARSQDVQQDPCGEQEENPQPDRQPNRTLSPEVRKLIADAVKDARLDVWTGAEDKIMRRLNVALRFDVPEADQAKANGLRRGDLRFDMTLGGVNEPQDIKAPAGARPLDELLQRFGGQVPGLGGAGSGGSGGSGGPSDGGAGAGASEYERCVAEAGGDVEKLQQCSDLIGR